MATEIDKALPKQGPGAPEWLKAAVPKPNPQDAQPLPLGSTAPLDGPQSQWTLWEEASSIMAALDRLAAQIRRTRVELENNLMEVERLIGAMPKRS